MNLEKKLFLLLAINFAMQSIYAIEQDLLNLEQQLTALAYAQPAPEECEEDVTETPDVKAYQASQQNSDGSESESEEEFVDALEAPEDLVEIKLTDEKTQQQLAMLSPEDQEFVNQLTRVTKALLGIRDEIRAQKLPTQSWLQEQLGTAQTLSSSFGQRFKNNPLLTEAIKQDIRNLYQEIADAFKTASGTSNNAQQDFLALDAKFKEIEEALRPSITTQATGIFSSWFKPAQPQPADKKALLTQAQELITAIKNRYQVTDQEPALQPFIKRVNAYRVEINPGLIAQPVIPAPAQPVNLPIAQPVNPRPASTTINLPVAQPVEKKE